MPEIVVAAQGRAESGKNVNRRLRAQGLIPGVLYGAAKKSIAVAVSPKEITTILRSASGENTLFDLEIEGKRRKVILKEFQLEPVKGQLLHADFYEVALDRLLAVKVHVEIQGTPVGVKVQGGILDFVTRELEVECLPTDIPDKIVVDVSALELGKHVRVSDLTAPPKVKLLTAPEVVVVHVVAPRAEEAPVVAEVAAEGATVAEPEVIKKGKVEGEAVEEKPEKPEKKEKK
ncbi:MAG: 50S ribosomal protein L25 [Vicinamibacteria bacterium]